MNYCQQNHDERIDAEADNVRNDTPNYQFQILESRVVNNQSEATHLEYLINITDVSDDNNINNQKIDKSWQVWKRIKHVHMLQKSLDEMFKNTSEMPPSVQVMKQYWLYSESKTSGLTFDEKKKALERYLNDLASNDAISTSEPFLAFIRGDDILDFSSKKMKTNQISNINMNITSSNSKYNLIHSVKKEPLSNSKDDILDDTFSPESRYLTKSYSKQKDGRSGGYLSNNKSDYGSNNKDIDREFKDKENSHVSPMRKFNVSDAAYKSV